MMSWHIPTDPAGMIQSPRANSCEPLAYSVTDTWQDALSATANQGLCSVSCGASTVNLERHECATPIFMRQQGSQMGRPIAHPQERHVGIKDGGRKSECVCMHKGGGRDMTCDEAAVTVPQRKRECVCACNKGGGGDMTYDEAARRGGMSYSPDGKAKKRNGTPRD